MTNSNRLVVRVIAPIYNKNCEKCGEFGINNVVISAWYNILCDDCVKKYNNKRYKVVKWDKMKYINS